MVATYTPNSSHLLSVAFRCNLYKIMQIVRLDAINATIILSNVAFVDKN